MKERWAIMRFKRLLYPLLAFLLAATALLAIGIALSSTSAASARSESSLFQSSSKFDGGPAYLVKDIDPTVVEVMIYPGRLTAVGDRIFFSGDDGINGRELWLSDGSASGTAMVLDINPGHDHADIDQLVSHNGELFFSAFHGYWEGIWKSDGSVTNTMLIKPIALIEIAAVNDMLYFSAWNQDWVTLP